VRPTHATARPRHLLVPCRVMPGDGNVGVTLDSVPGRPHLVRSGAVGPATLDVWLLESEIGEIADPSVLDEDERRRAVALEAPGLRQRFVLAHAALRHLLGRALGVPARDVQLARLACPRCGRPGGRPVLGGTARPVEFSLSASEHLVLIALASAPVGVDLEAVPALQAVEETSELLHPAERQELLAMAPEDRRANFTRLWSRKEAYLKGTGVGIGHGLGDVYVGTGLRAAAPDGWTLAEVPVPPDFSGWAAVRTDLHDATAHDGLSPRAS
jgi:4'-phosphopantetheinyl transferase